MEKDEEIKNLKNNINNLCKLAYPLSIDKINSKVNILTDNCMSVDWKYKKEIRCQIDINPEHTSITIAHHFDKQLEVINYFRQKNCEMLYYYPTDWENRVCLNLTNNKIRKGEIEEEAKENDYEMFNEILFNFSRKILDCLSSLQEETISTKKKSKKIKC